MMNGMNFAPPPGLKGDEKSQLVQMHSFLFRLTEQLNAALSQTDTALQNAQAAAAASGKSVGGAAETEYRELKSLIIKSADAVRAEMDVIEARLESEYVAQSEFGEFRETITADITATAESIDENYNHQAEINSEVSAFISNSRGYIRRGIVGYDDAGNAIYGIAIGEGIKTTTIIDETTGEEIHVINADNNMALYTANKLSFHQNGAEVAYFSSSTLHTTRTNIADKISLGISSSGHWEIDRKYGFSIKWVPGDTEGGE